MTLNGTNKRVLVRGGRQVWPCVRLDPLPQMDFRMVLDTDGYWFEVGFQSPEELTGSAADGWTDPREYCLIRLQNSMDLVTWDVGDFEDCPGSPEEQMDGSWIYWSRATIPSYWRTVLVDFTVASARYGKDITAITLMTGSVSLPNFPYAMPADAATLQMDLRAEGYTDATVTVTSAGITATAQNHMVTGIQFLTITQSGGSVTGVANQSGSISLPSYPYALPGDAADLQADLRTAGVTGAVVQLHGDEWEIFLPDLAAVDQVRDFKLTIDPGDPYPAWDFFGTYVGLRADDEVIGASGNVRNPSGDPLIEAGKQFVRMEITRGARVLP